MDHEDVRERGFRRRTRVSAARDKLAEVVAGIEETKHVPVGDADGRIVAESVTAERNVPHYDRAAMDGYAVVAEDTFGASERSPVRLALDERGAAGVAVPVHTGSPLPAGADAVVMLEETEVHDGELDVFDAVATGENVGETGEDVAIGDRLYDAGDVLGPSDRGLLTSLGHETVAVVPEPDVAVLPTGEELVQTDPAPGEIIETNGLTVSRLVERWGGSARYRDIVTDDETVLRAAITENLDADVVVTTGGSSVGQRDLLPHVIDDIGEVLVHGVALRPGHPVALGVVEETPVLALPGYPVACLINAVQFLRPTIKWLLNTPVPDHPTIQTTAGEKLRSEPGTRTFARVQLEPGEDGPIASPLRLSGAGVLSSVTRADGWVVIEEALEGIPAGETVTVERWEWSA